MQPWDRPQALLGKGGGWIAAVGSPTGAAGEGGRWSAAVGSPTGAPGGGWRVGGQPWDGPLALPREVCEGQGQGGTPLGFPLPLTHEVTHLQTCSRRWEGRGHGDTVLAMQYTPLCR